MKKDALFILFVLLSLVSNDCWSQVTKEKKTERDGLVWYLLKDGEKRGAESESGKKIISLSHGYDVVTYEGKYYRVKRNGFSGACDLSGKEIISPSRGYDVITYVGKYYRVQRNGFSGACDLSGKEIIAPQYKSIIYSLGFEYCGSDGQWVQTGLVLDEKGLFKRKSPHASSPKAAEKVKSPKVVKPMSTRSLLADAARLESKKKYGKAQKIYKQILKRKDLTPADYAYVRFLDGRCCYQNRKWKDAINAFDFVVNRSPSSDATTKASAKTLLASAREQRQAQLQRRAQTWAAIGASMAMTTAAAFAAHSQSSYTAPSTSSSYRSASNLNYLLDPNYAIMQVQQQEQQEYLMAKQYRPDLTLEQFRMERGQAAMMMKEAERNGGGSAGTSSFSNTSTATSSSSGSSFCRFCSNTKRCHVCGGDGRRTDNYFGTGKSPTEKCGTCHGNGVCVYCK